MRYYVSIVYLGAGIGALLSFFINDRIGRLWSWRLYVLIWSVGQIIAALSPTVAGLYASRIISGLGIGPLTVTGTMSIVEIAPTEIRGLLAVWFSVFMTAASVSAVFCVYGVYIHIEQSRLQYQIVMVSPIVFFAFVVIASFFLSESPRWQWITGRQDAAVTTLVRLRGLPVDHPRVQRELSAIQEAVQKETEAFGHSSSRIVGLCKEMFTVPANLRRLQQSLVAYGLAQLSGANSITSYFVPIIRLLGSAGGTTHSLFLSGMYSFSKLCFTLIASFFFIDALGRRGSLFTGASLQMISDIYLAVYLKYQQAGKTNEASGQAAIAALFVHAFGYAVGESQLPARCLLIATDNGSRTFRSSLRVRRRTLSEPAPIFWWRHLAMFSLYVSLARGMHITLSRGFNPHINRALLLRHELCRPLPSRFDPQLGRISILRCLVSHRHLLRVLHGS